MPRYAKNAGIKGRTHGLKKETRPAKNAKRILNELAEEIPPTFSQIKKLDANAKFAILLN